MVPSSVHPYGSEMGVSSEEAEPLRRNKADPNVEKFKAQINLFSFDGEV